MKDKQRIWGFLAHTSIIVGMMFVVFFAIDRFNPAMEFLTSSLSKWLILVLALCAIFTGLYSAVFLFRKQKRRDEKRSHPQAKPVYEREYVPQERFAQSNFNPRADSQGRQSNAAVTYPVYQQAIPRPKNGQPQAYQRYADEQSRNDYERRDTHNR